LTLTCGKCTRTIEASHESVFYKSTHYHRNCFLQLFERAPTHSVKEGPLHHDLNTFILLRDLELNADMNNYDPAKDTLHTLSLSTTDLELLSHLMQSRVRHDSKIQKLYGRLQIKLSESNEFAYCQRKKCPNHTRLIRLKDMIEGEASRDIVLELSKIMPLYKKHSGFRKVLLFCSTRCDETYRKQVEGYKIEMERIIEEQTKKAAQSTKTQPLATQSGIEEKKKQKEEEEKEGGENFEVCCECNMHHAVFSCGDCGKWIGRGKCTRKHNTRHYEEEQVEIKTEVIKAETKANEVATDYAMIEEHLENFSLKHLKTLWFQAKGKSNGDYHLFKGKKILIQDWKDIIQDVITIKFEMREE